MRRPIAVLAVLFSATVMSEGLPKTGGFPKVGSYAFDWLQPNITRCRKVTPKLAKKFGQCEFSTAGNSFAQSKAYYKCDVSDRSEYFLYPTHSECVNEFETMQANGD